MTTEEKKNAQELTRDARWQYMEMMIMEYIEPLSDITKIDTSKNPEVVTAELIVRKAYRDAFEAFLADVKNIQKPDRSPVSFT